jgi:hypothetical protein
MSQERICVEKPHRAHSSPYDVRNSISGAERNKDVKLCLLPDGAHQSGSCAAWEG